MGLLSDTLRHLLASDPAERRAGLRGLVGRMVDAEPVVTTHPSMQTDGTFDIVHYRKPVAKGGALSRPRSFALTLTLGLAETEGRELVALTLADVRDPSAWAVAWMLAEARRARRGALVELPEGCLGRSSHTWAAIVEPWAMAAQDLQDWQQLLGVPLDLVLPITPREATFARSRGLPALLEAMVAQSVPPWADRPAGQTELPDAGALG